MIAGASNDPRWAYMLAEDLFLAAQTCIDGCLVLPITDRCDTILTCCGEKNPCVLSATFSEDYTNEKNCGVGRIVYVTVHLDVCIPENKDEDGPANRSAMRSQIISGMLGYRNAVGSCADIIVGGWICEGNNGECSRWSTTWAIKMGVF